MTAHRHAGNVPVECTEIADDVCLREWRYDGKIVRFLIAHDVAGAEVRCEGSIPVGRSEHPVWASTGTLAGGDLTLTPSVLEPPGLGCPGMHGFVRDGRWVPA